ncbi:MAG: branched-chain amino acid ABC transporter substrate-binding protein, partial [Pseudomonas sp.]
SQILPLSYRTLVVILAGFSLVVSNLGLTKLIMFSIPLLTAIYPPCIVLVALSFCKGIWNSPVRIMGPVMAVSLLFGMVDAIKGTSLAHILPDAVAHLPLSEQGLAWLVPSALTLGAAMLCDWMLGKPREALA